MLYLYVQFLYIFLYCCLFYFKKLIQRALNFFFAIFSLMVKCYICINVNNKHNKC